MYPEEIVLPMREELTSVGFKQVTTSSEIESAIKSSGTTLVVVNSVCGCAAANARPGVRLSLENEVLPSKLTTVFAGVDREATDKARSLMVPFPLHHHQLLYLKMGNWFT